MVAKKRMRGGGMMKTAAKKKMMRGGVAKKKMMRGGMAAKKRVVAQKVGTKVSRKRIRQQRKMLTSCNQILRLNTSVGVCSIWASPLPLWATGFGKCTGRYWTGVISNAVLTTGSKFVTQLSRHWLIPMTLMYMLCQRTFRHTVEHLDYETCKCQRNRNYTIKYYEKLPIQRNNFITQPVTSDNHIRQTCLLWTNLCTFMRKIRLS